MAFLQNLIILSLLFIPILFLLFIYTRLYKKKNGISTNWPILGMLPGILMNFYRLHDYATEALMNSGGTFIVKGPWFTNTDMLLTTDPSDVHHILSKNFNNYPKGDKFRLIFDILGDGILAADGKIWEISHKVTMSILKHESFQTNLETIIWNKVENGLLPALESIYAHGTEIDMQDIFQRFAFDTTCKLLFDEDAKSLSLDFPYTPCLKAFTDVEEAVVLRHVTPPFLWKLQEILRIGKEHKIRKSRSFLDEFIHIFLKQNQNEYGNYMNLEHQKEEFSFFTSLVRGFKLHCGTSLNPTNFLRDSFINLMGAGKDTTSSALSWFFYCLMKNPIVYDEILKEIQTHLGLRIGERWHVNELDKLVYLHGALYESLRLFPPIPFNHKSPLQPDILPSGHKVDKNTKIILSFYSMGRMKSIWGEDCMEFKPERWISENGRIKHEPSYKFASFNAGPRTCIGKNIALSSLKIVSTMIIYNYHMELVQGHLVRIGDSMVLQMKHGLKVILTKRSDLN